MRLGCRILGVLPILCIVGFKWREKWISLCQMEYISIYLYIYISIYIYINIYIYIYIYTIMNTMCPPGYYHNCFVATHALGGVGTWCTSGTPYAQVHELLQSHCGDKWEGKWFWWLHIYINLILLLWDLSILCVVDHFWPLI